MKKYSSREKLLFRLILLVVVVAVGQEAWIRHKESIATMNLDIEAAREHQALLLEKLKVDQDRLERDIKKFDDILETSYEQVLRMPNESEAIFEVQETLSNLAEQAEINMNSQNKRRSRTISEETGLLEIRTYFGYDCRLENLLIFFDLMKEQPYYTAIDTLNINSYSRRRSRARRRDPKQATRRDKIRGSVVISTLFLPGVLGEESATAEPEQPSAASTGSQTPEGKEVVAGKPERPADIQVSQAGPPPSKDEQKTEKKAEQAKAKTRKKTPPTVQPPAKTQTPTAPAPKPRNLTPIPKPLTHTTRPRKK